MSSEYILQWICLNWQRVFVSLTLIMLCLQSIEGYPGNHISPQLYRLEGHRVLVARRDTEETRGRSRQDPQPTTPDPSQLENDPMINTTFVLETGNTTKANTTLVTTDASDNKGNGQGAGTIIGAFFGVLLGCAIVGGALYLLIRYKRAQSAEYSRSVQIHMSSTRNAGVYVDLAEPRDPRLQDIDYTALQHNKAGKKDTLMQSDLYEYDSDDEVCVYK